MNKKIRFIFILNLIETKQTHSENFEALYKEIWLEHGISIAKCNYCYRDEGYNYYLTERGQHILSFPERYNDDLSIKY